MMENNLAAQAREHGLPEVEVLKSWEEMRKKHRLPFYVFPLLETRPDGTVALSPAVDVNLLSRVEQEVPGWEAIRGPTWPDRARAS
jgi:hypothetical protein